MIRSFASRQSIIRDKKKLYLTDVKRETNITMIAASLIVAIFALFGSGAVAQVPQDGVAALIGGFGGGISLELVTETQFCTEYETLPPLPNAPGGNLEGWSSEYVDELIWLCGGANINQVRKRKYNICIQMLKCH